MNDPAQSSLISPAASTARGSSKVVGHAIAPSLINTDAALGGYGFSLRGHACAGRREHRKRGRRYRTRVEIPVLTRFPALLISSTRPRFLCFSRVNQEAIRFTESRPSPNDPLFIKGTSGFFHEVLEYDCSSWENSHEFPR